ncbi:MAG TPA: ATP-binding protein [Ktedonobacteraceae bacterium]|nr:ATP-binding protein [Ktedonobacteraceae bacterium]
MQEASLETIAGDVTALIQQYEARLAQQRKVLDTIIDIGASLRLQMDTQTLLKRVCGAACEALQFRIAALYLYDGLDYYRYCALAGGRAEDETYLREHPLPESIVSRLASEEYRVSRSYHIPAEASIWQDEEIKSFFVVDETVQIFSPSAIDPDMEKVYWHAQDLMIVPLIGGDNTWLGFLTPDGPLDGLRPSEEIVSLFELFANQAAVVIEGARLHNELREALRQAQESEQIKNHFLMIASHELRTPLTAMQGYLELLSQYGDSLDEETRSHFLNNTQRACDELVLLLGNVMDISRVDQNRVSLNFGVVNVAQTVEVIVEILEPIIDREQRPVKIDISADLLVWVDELRLRQIMLNLLGNALKYTPAGTEIAISATRLSLADLHCHISPTPALEYQSTMSPSHQFALIAIRDRGPGISREDQSRLFTKFMRLDSTQQGSGLGLYLCRQLTEAMGGQIWVESSGIPGEGSTFFLTVPCYQS